MRPRVDTTTADNGPFERRHHGQWPARNSTQSCLPGGAGLDGCGTAATSRVPAFAPGDRAVAVHTLAVTPSPDSGGRVNTPAPRAAADQVAPLLRVGLPGTRRLLRALRRGIPVEVSCSELCRLTVTIRLAPRMARRLGVRVLVAQRAETLEASLRRTLRLAFGRRLAARLAPLSRLRLRVGVSATDSAGNRATVGRTLALRRR